MFNDRPARRRPGKGNYAMMFVLQLISLISFGQSDEYERKKGIQLAGPSPFERELRGELPERVIYEDTTVLVLDGNPSVSQTPIHLIIIPRKRIPTINDANEQDDVIIAHMIHVAKMIAAKKGIDQTGYRLVINTNEDAGQSAFHLHLHLLGGVTTGPMVDQGWRNIQKAKRAVTNSEFSTRTTEDSMLMKLLGRWQSSGTAFGSPAKITLRCEPAVQFQFVKFTYTIQGNGKPFEGEAFYRPAGKNKYVATWIDTNGSLHPISASAENETLTSLWGTAETQEGKTIYQLLSDAKLSVTDYIKDKDGAWIKFNSNVLLKEY